MTVKKLNLPTPWGNQPADPADDPLSYLIASYYGNTDCLAGFDQRPPRACLLGKRAECAWGIRSEEFRWCAWYLLEKCPDQEAQPTRLAELLGVSKQRAQYLIAESKEAATCLLKERELNK